MNEQTIRCPICGKPYLFYSMYAGDQSACPSCREKAREDNSWTKKAYRGPYVLTKD